MEEQIVLRTTAKVLMPFMMLFGLYVIMHGESGPGGGFQGGVILASAFILYTLIYGLEATEKIVRRKTTDLLAAFGVMIYAGVGLFTLARGGKFLDYNQLRPADPGAGQALGMTLVEIGVGLTVCAVMITLFREFAEKK